MKTSLFFSFRSRSERPRSDAAIIGLARAAKRLKSSAGYIPQGDGRDGFLFWARLPREFTIFDAERHTELWRRSGVTPSCFGIDWLLSLREERMTNSVLACLDGERGRPTFSVMRIGRKVSFWSYDIEKTATPGFVADFFEVAKGVAQSLAAKTGAWASEKSILSELGHAVQAVYD